MTKKVVVAARKEHATAKVDVVVNEEKRDNFAKKYAAWVTFFGCVYLLLYTWLPLPKHDDSKLILGFVMGTMLGTAITWAIGSSKSSNDKNILIGNKPQ